MGVRAVTPGEVEGTGIRLLSGASALNGGGMLNVSGKWDGDK